MFNNPSSKKKKILVKTIPDYNKFCLWHQSSTLTYALKSQVAEGDSKQQAHGTDSGT